MSPVTALAIARVAYEARRAYARALGEEEPPTWEVATPRQRMEAMLGVQAVLSGEARSGRHLHEALARSSAPVTVARSAPRYEQLAIEQRRKILLFRAVALALVDGPCDGFCHDEKCGDMEDHACHLDTCMSRYGVPPGLWEASVQASVTGSDGPTLYS
jgi:hypothetical protein